MNKALDHIHEQIARINPLHSKKLKSNSAFFDDRYYELADDFFKKYTAILENEGKDLDHAIDGYLQMIADVHIEAVEFARTGKYSSSTFEEVNRRVYATPGVMEYYMHGLIMSQFLWKHHYQMFDYFITSLPRYVKGIKNYLEVGVGHGFYLSKALEILEPDTKVTVVDISETSIGMAKRFVNDDRVNFNLKDIFEYSDDQKYDVIVLGEVLEHVEDPIKLLLKLNSLLNDNGTLFFTTPTNAPAIDHIYLFNNVDEILDVIGRAGFKISSETALLSEDVTPKKAERFKITILYGAFLKKNKGAS